MVRNYVLRGSHPKFGEVEQYFTQGEHTTALEIARLWFDRGWQPFLFSQDGASCRTWFNFRTYGKRHKMAA